jgi:opacity protein-like surface antigen
MKRTIGTFILAGLLALPQIALAQTYVEIRAGGLWTATDVSVSSPDANEEINGATVSFDTGWTGAIAVGRDFAGPLRAEIEYSHRSVDVGDVTGTIANPAPPPAFIPFTGTISGSADIDALMLNGYVDTPIRGGPLGVYVGMGAGVAFVDTTFNGLDRSDTNFAFQGMAGAFYEASPDVTITAGYNLFVTEDVSLGNGSVNMTNHSVLAGLRFNF